MSIPHELTKVYHQMAQIQHAFGRVQNGPDAPPQICALAEKLAEQMRGLTLLVQRIAIDLKFPLDHPIPDVGAGCDDPALLEEDHRHRTYLQEVADGAYGDGPLRRRAARERLGALGDCGQGSREESFTAGRAIAELAPGDVMSRITNRQRDWLASAASFCWENEGPNSKNMPPLGDEEFQNLAHQLGEGVTPMAENMVILSEAERAFLRWAVYSYEEAQDGPPPAIPTDEAIADLLHRLGRPTSGDEFENEHQRAGHDLPGFERQS